MIKVIFYSWQSDLPNSTNRGFIGDALTKAANDLLKDKSIAVEPVIDRDTQGVSGSPDISKTIFEKIDASDIFVADVSIINKGQKSRSTPNPNVLIELGYAFKSLGHNRTILVMNKQYGGPELLPFDLKMRRILVYDTSNHNPQEKTLVKNRLGQEFEGQIRTILSAEENNAQTKESAIEQVIKVVKDQVPRRVGLVRSYMKSFFEDLDKLYPGTGDGREDYDEDLLKSWDKTKDAVKFFGKLIEEIAVLDDEPCLKQVLSNFPALLEKFDLPMSHSGHYDRRDQDFYKFIGNELFVTMIAVLMREQKWSLVKSVLETNYIVPNAYRRGRDTVSFNYFSQYLLSLELRNKRLSLSRSSLQADILKDRHSNSLIKEVVNFDSYLAADYLLFIKGESPNPNNTDAIFGWFPQSLVYLSEVPRFILEAQSKKTAQEIADALGLPDTSTLSVLIINKTPKISSRWSGAHVWNRIDKEVAEKIGTRV